MYLSWPDFLIFRLDIEIVTLAWYPDLQSLKILWWMKMADSQMSSLPNPPIFEGGLEGYWFRHSTLDPRSCRMPLASVAGGVKKMCLQRWCGAGFEPRILAIRMGHPIHSTTNPACIRKPEEEILLVEHIHYNYTLNRMVQKHGRSLRII